MNIFKLNFTDYFFQGWNISISEFYPYRNGFFLTDTNGNNYLLKSLNEDPRDLERYINYFNNLRVIFKNSSELVRTINGKISQSNFYLLSFPKGEKVNINDKNHKRELINAFKMYFKVCNNAPIGFLKNDTFLDDFYKNKLLLENKYFEISDKVFKNNIEEKFIRNYFKFHEILNKNLENIDNIYKELSVNSYPKIIQYFDIDNMYFSYSNKEVYFVDFSIPKNELRAISLLKIVKRFNWNLEDFIENIKPYIFNLEIEFIKNYLNLPVDFMIKYLKYFNDGYFNEKDFERIEIEPCLEQ